MPGNGMGEVWKRKGFKPDNIRRKYWGTSELSVSLNQQAGWRCSGGQTRSGASLMQNLGG